MAAPRASLGGPLVSRRSDPVPAALRRLLEQLGEVGATREFYLAGGTGLALVLAHRRSVDLDFFSRTNRLDFVGRRALLARLRRLPRWTLVEARDGTVHGRVGPVRVSFFWYDEPLVKPLIRRGSLRIASLEDLGLMKLGAIVGRGSRKDFVDLYAICHAVPLPRLLTLSRRKFTDARDFILQTLKALSFFEDADREPPVVAASPLAWDRVKAFFDQEARRLARRYLSTSGRLSRRRPAD